MTFNYLSEDFPSSVLQLTNLIALRLDNAGLAGSFPAGLSKLGNLQYLYLGNNSMTGSLPSELGSLNNLVELSLWRNNFASSIPTQLGSLVKLKYLNLHDCNLSGALPSEFQNLKSMERLMLYDNALTGPIPETWKNMGNLQNLQLQHNYLTNSFPFWIENLPGLQHVDISFNNFYGSISNITSHPMALNIGCNFFSGSSPTTSLGIKLTDSPNCFGTNYQDDNRKQCASFDSCSSFNKTVLVNRYCPQCPVGQTLLNASSCVCLGVSTDQGSGDHSASIKIAKIVGTVGGVALFILFGCFGFLVFKRLRRSKNGIPMKPTNSKYENKFDSKEPGGYWEAPKEVTRFSLEELAKATADFGSDHEIGVGGFGKVFYGLLANGKQVAIKRASASSMQGSSEFRNEVLLLSRLHHRNLVRLEGFCEDNELQILVYEYVPNGNLHTHLFQNNAGHSFNWLKRLDVAVGIAQGLDYLHSFADPPVIHRDVKPSNILLDKNLVAKVADFGISKTTLEFETHISTTPAGTAGYIDPQYFLRRQLTTASDVYGFGVVLLELITGQKAIDHTRIEELNLVEWVKLKLKMGGLDNIIDPRMGGDYPKQVYYDFAQLALSCASFSKNERPSMKEAVIILDACLRASYPPSPPRAMNYPQDEDSNLQMLEEEMVSFQSSGASTLHSTLEANTSTFGGSNLLPR